jgi:hypothetical protein
MLSNAVVQTLQHACRSLDSIGIEYAVMGGISVSVRGHIRSTRDVDLLISANESDAIRLIDQLKAVGLRSIRHPPVLVLDETRLVSFEYEPPESFVTLRVDMILVTTEFQKIAISRRTLEDLPWLGGEVYVLACEDLIVHKLLAGRVIDRADAAALLRINRDTLDLKHLTTWIARLSLRAEFAEVWDEAYPGEVPPCPDPSSP